jgi:hypothetical protein
MRDLYKGPWISFVGNAGVSDARAQVDAISTRIGLGAALRRACVDSAREAERMNNGLVVSAWFEGQEMAAKRGSRVFAQMLRRLGSGDVQGIVIHKSERSTRNLRDWAHA